MKIIALELPLIVQQNRRNLKTKIHVLKAAHGDCILIKTFDAQSEPFTILIDGGTYETFDLELEAALDGVKVINLLVLTHIDSDHIEGLVSFVESELFDRLRIENYWINCANLIPVTDSSGKISYDHAFTLENLLIDKKVDPGKLSKRITGQQDVDFGNGITIDVYSPSEDVLDAVHKNWPELSKHYKGKLESLKISGNRPSQLSKGELRELALKRFKHDKTIEKDIFNSSSIAFTIWGVDFSFLSLADSRAELIETALLGREYNSGDNKLVVDYVKVSHHGSKNNTSVELLDLIGSDNFIFSTNGGTGRSRHPSRETIARILYHPARNANSERNLYFNYPLSEIEFSSGKIFTDEEMQEAKINVFDDINVI